MKKMKLIEKFKKMRILPERATKVVRLVVLGSVVGLLYQPVVGYFGKEEFNLRHLDMEAGIDCVITGGENLVLSCEKREYVGMTLTEVELDKKNWNYDLPTGETVVVSREGYSDGVKVSVTSTNTTDKATALIPYKNIDLQP